MLNFLRNLSHVLKHENRSLRVNFLRFAAVSTDNVCQCISVFGQSGTNLIPRFKTLDKEADYNRCTVDIKPIPLVHGFCFV